ncbi:prephenate dehydratase [Sulfoacidibacillus thermotolerans]|uniref:Prephenate dehydratase n=1 Tax=Sulfoacidibacillus thermotolerans TaxID=1765684 RepID=A0A2U3DB51_SULT2|nr:prephenate dehydratase [Sulfoacidibacillus thermotolerans]PWI58511.1 hypothetical protein BM613_03035 [Sulfoacidibacillus thermotolerans]
MRMLGFLGPSGTYTEQAAHFFADKLGVERSRIHPFSSISRVFDAVENNEVQYAAVPIENSLEGSVLVTLDRLAAYPLRIFAEVALPIRHTIFGLPGTDPHAVRQVLSHPQALAQCRQTLMELFPNAEHVDVESTAAAILHVAKERDHTLVCVGSLNAGRAQALEVLRVDAQDISDNVTRFVLLGRREHAPYFVQEQKADTTKTSLLLQLGDDHPGALYAVLKVFAQRQLNLSRLESRPTKRGLGSYQFYIDVLGNSNDQEVVQAMEEISAIAGFSVRDLGTYPCFSVSSQEI